MSKEPEKVGVPRLPASVAFPSWTAWVPSGIDAVYVTDAMQALRGRRIVGVRYHDLAYEERAAFWHAGHHDEIAQGLELSLDDGQTWSIRWEQSTYEGLGVRAEPMPGDADPESVWDVTERWKRLGPRQVSAVETHWWSAGVTRNPGSSGQLLAGVVLRDGAREAVIVLGARLDGFVYFSVDRARRDRHLTDTAALFHGPTDS